MINDEQLEAFCAVVKQLRDKHYNDVGNGADYGGPVTFMRGGKYARIVVQPGGNPSVFAFVKLDTGDILKAAGWNAPAKHVRGNISNGAADVGPYGPHYLR